MPHPQAARRHKPVCRKRRHGFTLIELLVVVGIMTLIIGIALPVILGARNSAKRTAMSFQLQAIATGLEAYRQDFKGAYPAIDPARPVGDNGAFVLCRLLIAPAPDQPAQGVAAKPDETYDLFYGAGFRLTPGGKVYGPYLQPDNFRYGLIKDLGNGPELTPLGYVYTPRDYSALVIVDQSEKPILYAPASPNKPRFSLSSARFVISRTQPTPTPLGANDTVYFDIDNLTGLPTNTPELTDFRKILFHAGETTQAKFIERVQRMLGDKDIDSRLGSGETNAFGAPYLLWSAGVDGIYGDVEGKRPDDVVLTDGGR